MDVAVVILNTVLDWVEVMVLMPNLELLWGLPILLSSGY
jgi:hypothetical protein